MLRRHRRRRGCRPVRFDMPNREPKPIPDYSARRAPTPPNQGIPRLQRKAAAARVSVAPKIRMDWLGKWFSSLWSSRCNRPAARRRLVTEPFITFALLRRNHHIALPFSTHFLEGLAIANATNRWFIMGSMSKSGWRFERMPISELLLKLHLIRRPASIPHSSSIMLAPDSCRCCPSLASVDMPITDA